MSNARLILSAPRALELRAGAPRWLPALVGFFVLASDGIAGGAYLPRAWRLTTFAFLALAAAALIAKPRVALAPIERCMLAAFAALAAWTTLSTFWSSDSATSLLEGERTLVYLAAVTAVLVSVDREALPQLLAGALGGVTVICGYGLGTYVIFGHELNPIEGNLLFEPLGYANGLGIYAAIGLLLAAGLALATPHVVARAACAVCAAILVPTLYLTSSRAAMVALAFGLVVLFAFARPFPRKLTFAVAALSTSLVAAVLLMQSEQGLVRHLVGNNRPLYWHVAWREYKANPGLGSGAGTFDDYWLRWRTVGSFARDAHSLYLETLAELGPMGLLLLLVALLLPLVALRDARDPLRATAAAGYVAYLVHAGVDWDWELPAVTIAGLLCGTALLITSRRNAPELGGRSRAALFVLTIGFAVFALVRLRSGPALPFGQ